MPIAEIARIAYFRSDTLPPGTQAQLTVSHHFAPQGYPFAFTNGIQGCSLEVDVDTGLIKLLKHFIVEDCGRVINPMLVDEQLRGGIVQGLGAVLLEECRYSETGQLVNGSLADYLVPMPMEMPDIVIAHVETPTADTELGAKGVGEAGTAAASACVLNAVNDALAPFGAAVNSIPITPTKVLKALEAFLEKTVGGNHAKIRFDPEDNPPHRARRPLGRRGPARHAAARPRRRRDDPHRLPDAADRAVRC